MKKDIIKLNIVSIDGSNALSFDFDKSEPEKSFDEFMKFLYENDKEKPKDQSFEEWAKEISFAPVKK